MTLYTDYDTIDTVSTDAAAINNAIRNILLTPLGSLPGKPTFGSNLYKLVFSQMDHTTEDLAKRFIKEALRTWEPRLIIRTIIIKEISEFNKMIITIGYEYRDKGLNINEQISLTYVQ